MDEPAGGRKSRAAAESVTDPAIANDESGLFSEHLEGLLRSDQRIDRVHKVFISRSLKMSSIRAIGFDMDHTLALYKKRPIEELAFRSTVLKLIRRPGYPSSLLKMPYDPLACIRGLIVDRDRGNILKVDQFNYVAVAYHGTQPIRPADIRRQYSEDTVRFDPLRHYSVDTLFSVPEVYLYEKLVDLIDRKTISGKTYSEAFMDVRACIDEAHRDGSIKSRVHEHPEKFFDLDTNLPLTLHKFRMADKKLFLLTNSDLAYVDLVLGFLLNGKLPGYPAWRDYFDLICVEAGKPGFYKRTEAAEPIDGAAAGKARIFRLGNAREMQHRLGVSGDRMLYFGDHTYDDILRTKRQFNWRTAMIVPGLAAEIKTSQKEGRLRTDLFKLFQDRDGLYLNVTKLYSQVARIRADKIHNFSRKSHAELLRMDNRTHDLFGQVIRIERRLSENMIKINALNRELFRRYNKYWGSEFSAGNEISRFAGQITDFACIYTGKVSNLLAYSPNKYFHKKRIVMPHESN